MRVIYQRSKGSRIKNSRFFGLDAESQDGYPYWYCEDTKEWYLHKNRPKNYSRLTTSYTGVNSLKSAIRHVKNSNVPKGTKFRLSSKFIGFDIYIIK